MINKFSTTSAIEKCAAEVAMMSAKNILTTKCAWEWDAGSRKCTFWAIWKTGKIFASELRKLAHIARFCNVGQRNCLKF